ncbi:hypothetical protein SERLA73DRAFT_179498 [Serpula lacrymans var. lacrymans S7.3]|uniref:PPM-type phosphatase domain-containing protein n=2 Tax=Serpula lacrymans var. lacrymans TaxID=341189 RepID=F8PSQ7_SERL3|nr:uncharacterized protein SERLADRAFT_464659 [Serpula lacrymans var. lacrymans S7.9]EGO01335.1 hypothetical protein SERLA73DRAFT_179498 [Serpula lacrymans var. lacrymans S7.3]EGO26973.1 hypothetical protein SERLADRAFT_464659 [Serpula lacrymans var. lacrymans S7.9]
MAENTYHTAFRTTCISVPNVIKANEDRYLLRHLQLPNGIWRMIGVFDGHAGEECVNYAIETFPAFLQTALSAALEHIDDLSSSSSAVTDTIRKAIIDYDNQILSDFLDLFPGGVEALQLLSDDEIKSIVNDFDSGGKNNIKVLRCMRGSTLLFSLRDPSGGNLWVASLGDCQAILGRKDSTGLWHSSVLSSDHNGHDIDESDRVQREHPGEQDCIMNDRVLGAIAVTRALGDHEFKIPAVYTRRVFLNTQPGFRVSSNVLEFIARNKTPPYLSNEADVRHVDMKSLDNTESFLILCSDGLVDLYMYDEQRTGPLDKIVARWVKIVGDSIARGDADVAPLLLLRDALDGDGPARVVRKVIVDGDAIEEDKGRILRNIAMEMPDKWMDDITLAVQRL